MLDCMELLDRIECNLSYTQRDCESFGIATDEADWILHQFIDDCMEEIEAGYNTYNPAETPQGRKVRYMQLISSIRVKEIC